MQSANALKNYLVSLFENFFSDSKITQLRLLGGTFDHIARLTTNNPGGVFSAIITATTAVATALGTAISHQEDETGERKGAVLVKDMSRAAFQTFVSRGEGTIRGIFGIDSSEYNLFFPHGLKYFGSCTDLEFGIAATNFANRCVTYVVQVGVPFKDSAVALSAAYATAATNVTTEKAEGTEGRITAEEAAQKVSEQLCQNWLAIATQFPLQPEKVDLYISTALFYPAQTKHIYKGKPAADRTELVAELSYSPGRSLHLKNKGAAELRFFMKLNGETVGNEYTVAAGAEITKAYSDFFSDADELYVTNLSTEHIGEYLINDLV